MKYALVLLLSLVNALKYVPFDKTQLDPSSVFEQFDYPSLNSSPWQVSTAKKFDGGRDEIVRYSGEWKIESSTSKYPGLEGDLGLVMKSRASHYAISYKLPHEVTNTNPNNNKTQDLVLQYEVKLQQGLTCGGAYIKLLDSSPSGYKFFNSETPYQIMFGPDVCGSENKIHFIIRKKLPNGAIEEKHLKHKPMARTNELTNLYTLIIKSNQDFEIRVNGQVAKAGNLYKNQKLFNPPFEPPKEIPDVDDKKPDDWDDRAYIPDPNVEKPEDYELKHEYPQIRDPNAVKPDEWDESAPRYIPDPDAVKPKDWNDAEKQWEPPLIVNPKCATGCGPWEAPLIPNHDYIGPWFPPDIKNPNYNGIWTPRLIPNPDYYQVKTPGKLDKPIGGIGFELWSIESDILFDNIYLGNSIAEAELIGNTTFKIKYELEADQRRENKPRVKNEPVAPPRNFEDIIRDDSISTFQQFLIFIKLFWLKQYVQLKDFYFELTLDPIGLIMANPLKTLLYAFLFLFSFTIFFGFASTIMFLLQGGEAFGSSSSTTTTTTTTDSNRKNVLTAEEIEIPSSHVQKIEILDEQIHVRQRK
ncbi:calnexin [Candida albicans P76067]|nr:calnexin [Candida albicans P76067]